MLELFFLLQYWLLQLQFYLTLLYSYSLLIENNWDYKIISQETVISWCSHIQWVPPECLFLCLLSLTFAIFFILWPMSLAGSSVSWCGFCFVCYRLIYEIYSWDDPSTYVYCVVWYHVIAAPSVNVYLHTFTLLLIIQNGPGLWAIFTVWNIKFNSVNQKCHTQ